MNVGRICLLVALITCMNFSARAVTEVQFGPAYGDVKLSGRYGAILDRMIENHYRLEDPIKLTNPYKLRRNCRFDWATEFWGKYMHAAMPLAEYSGSAKLRDDIARSIANLLPCQEEDGYLGDVVKECRFSCGQDNGGYDVWNVKYTLLGLLYHYDGTGAKTSLEAAKRLCDALITGAGPNGSDGRPLRYMNQCYGLGSCSVLEPVVWLYKRTGEKRFLDFADYIVSQLCDYPDGPNLLKQADIPVGVRTLEKFSKAFGKLVEQGGWFGRNYNRIYRKAYEQMSCYQGLLEYYEVTGRREFLDATVKTARGIAETEINLAGSGSAGEYWYCGRTNQTRNVSMMMETCVTTTWMRLCQKLLELTGDCFWADQIEKSFFNAYLASMSPDGSVFATYMPLNGHRSYGYNHCVMDTNCCNENGPRGYLVMLKSLLAAEKGAVVVNQYISSSADVALPNGDGRVKIRQYTRYPANGRVELWHDSVEAREFTLKLRVPAFSKETSVKVNGKVVEAKPMAGTYLALKRMWRQGDLVEIAFDMPVVRHRLNEHIAFTRGPVCLARDSRFDDGPLDEVVRGNEITEADIASFAAVQPIDDSMTLAVSGRIPAGYHAENHDRCNKLLPMTFHFTDFASAGQPWSTRSHYRVWLPDLVPGRD